MLVRYNKNRYTSSLLTLGTYGALKDSKYNGVNSHKYMNATAAHQGVELNWMSDHNLPGKNFVEVESNEEWVPLHLLLTHSSEVKWHKTKQHQKKVDTRIDFSTHETTQNTSVYVTLGTKFNVRGGRHKKEVGTSIPYGGLRRWQHMRTRTSRCKRPFWGTQDKIDRLARQTDTSDPEHRMRNAECRAQNPEHRTQNTEDRTQNTKHRTQRTGEERMHGSLWYYIILWMIDDRSLSVLYL